MSPRTLTIPYPNNLLLSLKESPEEFEVEARLLLAVKLLGARLRTGICYRRPDDSYEILRP